MSVTSYPPNEASGNEGAVSVRRFVNDEVASVASRFDDSDGTEFEFVCECGNLSCQGRARMTLAQYRACAPGSVVGH